MGKAKKNTYVKRSCIDGKIVWLYRGASSNGMNLAYWRTMREEVKRVRLWGMRMAERRHILMSLIPGCGNTSSINVLLHNKSFTKEQRLAIRAIDRLIRDVSPQGSEFYNHILEEARRRNSRPDHWKDRREKLFRYGKCRRPSDYQRTGKPRGGDHRSEAYRKAKAEAEKENNSKKK